jgi:integrase
MILTGWRRGEVLGLRWSEVDLPRRTAQLADTKTGASVRPLSELGCSRSGPEIDFGCPDHPRAAPKGIRGC